LVRVIAIVAERGRLPISVEGQVLSGVAMFAAGFLARVLDVDEQVLPSGVSVMPVISQPLGPTRKRLSFGPSVAPTRS
jgi:hypothetical protein